MKLSGARMKLSGGCGTTLKRARDSFSGVRDNFQGWSEKTRRSETYQGRVTDAVAPTQLRPSAHLTDLTGMVYSVAQPTRQFRVSLWAVT